MKKSLILTPSWLSALHWVEGGPKIQILWDSEVRGMGVRVYPSGSKSWVLTYFWHGKQRWWNFSTLNELTLVGARVFAAGALRDKAAGLDPREPYMGSIKVNDAFKQWMNTRDLKPRTQKEYTRTYNGYVATRLGNLSLKDIRSGMAQRLFSSMTEDHGPVQANRVVTMMRGMWNHFIKMEYLPPNRTNPWVPITLNKEKPKDRILSSEELQRLGDVLADPTTWDKYQGGEAILFILSTGLRKGEVENLKWSEVDLSEEDVVLNLRDTKTGPRSVPLGAEASRIVTRRYSKKQLSPYVFNNRLGRKLSLQRVWTKIRKEADLDGVRLHDLRHTFASYAAGENQSLTMISQLLGHKHAHTSSRYVHAYRDPVVRAANQTSAAIEQHLWR